MTEDIPQGGQKPGAVQSSPLVAQPEVTQHALIGHGGNPEPGQSCFRLPRTETHQHVADVENEGFHFHGAK